MFKWLIEHQWQAAIRSSIWQRKLVANIFMSLLILMIALNFLGIGLFLKPLLNRLAPDKAPAVLFNSFLLFYFGFDLLMRFVLQKVPGLAIQPYLHLPVKRSRLVHFLLSKSVWSLFNFLPLLIMIPVAFKIMTAYSLAFAWIWLTTIFILLLSNSYLTAYLKRQLFVKPTVVAACAVTLVAIIALDYFKIISVSQFSETLFGRGFQNPAFVLAPLALLAFLYSLNYRFLKSHTYLDDLGRDEDKKAIVGRDFAFLERFGEVGEYLALELKLIFRTKRLKSTLYMSPLFLLFAFLFYVFEDYRNYDILFIYMGIFISGMFMINYGQFILAWESNYFDAIISRRINLYQYFKAKYIIIIVSCVAHYLLMTPAAFIDLNIVLLNTALLFFNVGINSFILLFKSTYNRQRLDLNVSVMSMQGKDSKIFIVAIFLVIIPILIYLLFKQKSHPDLGVAAIGAIGLGGFLLHTLFLRLIVAQFNRQKYNIAAAFRQF